MLKYLSCATLLLKHIVGFHWLYRGKFL